MLLEAPQVVLHRPQDRRDPTVPEGRYSMDPAPAHPFQPIDSLSAKRLARLVHELEPRAAASHHESPPYEQYNIMAHNPSGWSPSWARLPQERHTRRDHLDCCCRLQSTPASCCFDVELRVLKPSLNTIRNRPHTPTVSYLSCYTATSGRQTTSVQLELFQQR